MSKEVDLKVLKHHYDKHGIQPDMLRTSLEISEYLERQLTDVCKKLKQQMQCKTQAYHYILNTNQYYKFKEYSEQHPYTCFLDDILIKDFERYEKFIDKEKFKRLHGLNYL